MIVKLLTETPFGISKLKRMLQRLVPVCTCQNATLLVITGHGSICITNVGVCVCVFVCVLKVLNSACISDQ